jgi:PAS domain S-box-containing protein
VFYEPPWLLPITNAVFVTAVFLIVAYVAMRNYQATGRIQLLLMGCGVLAFGVGGVVAGFVRSLPGAGANLNVTIYNTGALVGALFHFAAALILLTGISPEVGSERKKFWLAFSYLGLIAFMALLTAVALRGGIPPFFIQGVGPTPLRQWVLGSADILFAFSFLVFMSSYIRNGEIFLYWYSSALALTSISLTAFFIESAVGSPIGWTGRFSQYLGGIYFLVAIVTASRSAKARRTTFDQVLTASLSPAEEKFRTLAEHSPDMIERFDKTMKCIYLNQEALRLYAKRARSVIGKGIEEIGLPGSYVSVLEESIQRVFETAQPVEVEHYIPAEIGSRFYQSHYVPEFGADGTVENVLVVSRDLTERKLSEEALRETQARTAAILGGIADTFYSLDDKWRFTVVNPAAEQAPFGRPASELLGRVIWEVYPGLVGTHIHRHYLDAAEKHSLEHYVAQSPLNGRWYEVFMQGWRGGVDVYMRDITERKSAEEELRKSKDQLETRVRERTAELELRNKELQDFAFVASHDLQEPLRKIRTFGDLLANKSSVSLGETSVDYVRRMQKAAARMQNLLNSLLSYSRMTTKAEPLKETDLGKSVQAALSNLEITLSETSAHVDVGRLPTIRADRTQMVQLFQNLIANALKFRREGQAPRVKIYAQDVRDSTGACEIRVEDNGIGFEKRYLDKIFLPFQRLHGRDSRYDGVGMGLAICKRIVEWHGGEITATSEPGQGSTFIVRLPTRKVTL